MKSFEERKAEIILRSDTRIKKRKKSKKIFLTVFIAVMGLSIASVTVIPKIANKRAEQLPDDAVSATDIIADKTDQGIDSQTDGDFSVINKSETSLKASGEAEDETIIYNGARVPEWDELTIAEQYNELDFNGVLFSSRNHVISKSLVSEKIGEFTLNGYDEIADESHKITASAYSINKISSNCAVAIVLEGNYYVYTNPFYKPETLGDFIKDLNLEENLTFGTVSYDSSSGMGDEFKYEKTEYADVRGDKIWEMLLADTSLKNVYSNDANYEKTVISIAVSVSVLGYQKIGIWITEDGYLCTNILDTGKGFYLGKQKTENFINYLLENYKGEKTVYVQPTEPPQKDSYATSSSAESYDATSSVTAKKQRATK